MTTQIGQHQFVQLIKTPMMVVTDEDGKLTPIPDPEGEEVVIYGCDTCNLGWDEAQGVACIGLDPEDIFEHITPEDFQ